ncbi:hypothetical protein SGA01_55430 [Streptomyces gardneri]|uniref:Uncharacterized protein n=1 Tax=Streptomyces gardneri TaxID=66892 RepID=A0A4Y3RSA7_9ACTN|nr:hypothetical protein SGA01_55430 [Streptomyces gardneri]
MPQGVAAPGSTAGRAQAPAASRAQPMYTAAARGMTLTPITPVTLASWAVREARLRPIRTIG